MHNPSHYDRWEIKKELGVENQFLVTTLGLLSPDKDSNTAYAGLEGFWRNRARPSSARTSCISSRANVTRICASRERRTLQAVSGLSARALEQAKVRWCRVKDLRGANLEDCDVVFFDTYLDEGMLLKLYGATNVMVLPYLNMQQISSGVLADTLGSGRAAIATKFRYARELIYSNKRCPEGLVMGRYVRGFW